MITGTNFIGFNTSSKGTKSFTSFSTLFDHELPERFTLATQNELEEAITLASAAFPVYSQLGMEIRALFLETIAEEIQALSDVLLARCLDETSLPHSRLQNELMRTCGQLKFFAELLKEGWYVESRIDEGQPDRTPLSKPSIRRMNIPIGPVAVFGASNFPLAFSTAGGDTASALAAGCPVIYKAHSSHPGTNEYVSSAIIKAAKRCGMPEGVFSSLYLSHEDVIKLVQHPLIKAVGFTGSRSVGMRLFNAAVSRQEPIPVYAEMSAINPVILLPGALEEAKTDIAEALVSSVTMSAGQFCTNPGLILVMEDHITQEFLAEFAGFMTKAVPAPMLNKNISNAYEEGIKGLENAKEIFLLAESSTNAKKHEATPMAFTVAAADFIVNKKFSEEVFGPVTLFVRCHDQQQLIEILNEMEGQLTVTIHAVSKDEETIGSLLPIITQKAGRIVFGGYPTGVEVCHSMQHGGPFPSTTYASTTSVGSAAISRFLRPVAFQNFPNHMLPDELKDENPLNILRLTEGIWTKEKVENKEMNR